MIELMLIIDRMIKQEKFIMCGSSKVDLELLIDVEIEVYQTFNIAQYVYYRIVFFLKKNIKSQRYIFLTVISAIENRAISIVSIILNVKLCIKL